MRQPRNGSVATPSTFDAELFPQRCRWHLHIRERSPGHWAIILDINKGGKRRRKWHSFKGTKRDAQAECARLITTLNEGEYVEANKLTVGKFLLDRLTQWETAKRITPKSVERYLEIINNQIVPFLGEKRLQSLKAIDIEGWHNALVTSGRKDGKGGIAARSVGHAHRLLTPFMPSRSLRPASASDNSVRKPPPSAARQALMSRCVRSLRQAKAQPGTRRTIFLRE